MHRTLWWAVAVLAVATPGSPLADTIILRNGQQLSGRVTIDGDKARIELDVGGTVVVAKGEIAKTIVESPAAATGEAIAISTELMARLKAREDTHKLVEALLDEKEPARLKAEAELVRKGREALPIVRTAFTVATPVQRRHLLRVLAAVGDPASVPKIVEILRNPNEKELHVEAVKALAAIAGHDATLLLTELLVNSKDDEVRLECLKALAEQASPFAVPFIVESLRQDALRQAARAALATWDDPILIVHLLTLLDEGSRESRERLASLIARIVTPGHALLLTRLLEWYDDEKEVAKALRAGVTRLHRDFPVVGDVELLNAPQLSIRDSALEALRKLQKDKKKRGNNPRDWRDMRDEATEPYLLVAPVGTVARNLVGDIAADIETSLKSPGAPLSAKTKVSPRVTALAPWSEPRPRDARPLLAHLDREQAADARAVRLFGVTTAEFAVPGLEPAMAHTRFGGAILLSLAHLGESRDMVTSRARRLALHALARSLGLPPCTDQTCPSSAVYVPSDLDAKSSRYCATCRDAFIAAWAAGHDLAGFQYAAAGARLAAIAGRLKTRDAYAAAAYAYERAVQPLQAIEQWKSWQAATGTAAEPAQVALVTKRIELLDRAEKWLNRKKLTVTPPVKGKGPAP